MPVLISGIAPGSFTCRGGGLSGNMSVVALAAGLKRRGTEMMSVFASAFLNLW
jgi:hypothetical protein